MKKLIIFAVIIIALFGALMAVNYLNVPKLENNLYSKEKLDQSTIQLHNDPENGKFYNNIVLPEELDQLIEQKQEAFVYFFQSTCSFCKTATPILVPVAEELGVDLKQYNLLEFKEGWQKYQIESTPTIVHYVNGEKVDMIVGLPGKDPKEIEKEYRAWFEKELAK